MSRSMSSAMADELEKKFVSPVALCYLDVSGDPLWAWTGSFDITPAMAGDPLLNTGATFTGAGNLGTISDLQQDASGALLKVTLTFGPAEFDAGLFFDLMNLPGLWSMRAGVLWLGFLDTTDYSLLATPLRMMTGRMNTCRVQDAGEHSSIAMEIVSLSIDGQRIPNWRNTDAHQQLFFSGDSGFEYLPQLATAEMLFGVAGQTVLRRSSTPAPSGYNFDPSLWNIHF